MFDRTLLEPTTTEFVVVADTHYMLDTTGKLVELESRRRQTARAEVALKQIAALEAPFVVHLGDIAQEYPDTSRYEQAMLEAKAQLDGLCPVRHHVAGNQDIGDKPDPTSPGQPVLPEVLELWEKHFGPTWRSFDVGDVHIVLINSQLLNTTLPQAEAQREWLERDLAAADGKRICLFLHMPLFLLEPDEPHLGNYDNIGQPDRAWLLSLIERHGVQWVMSGHVHFPFFHRMGAARYLISQAPSFTRPGFSHLFSSGPPPDQGRDQAPLLGFYLIRAMPDRFDAHLIRTSGDTSIPAALEEGWQRVLTRLPKGLPEGQLAIDLRHPLASTAQVPTVWPSAVRQRVRNDLPLLACLELGVRHVRVPLEDCEDPLQRDRLNVLRDEGVQVVATALAVDPAVTPQRLAAARDVADQIEIDVVRDEVDDEAIKLIRSCTEADVGSVALGTIAARQPVPGKQHPRTRHGFRVDGLEALNERLAHAGVRVANVLCRLDPLALDLTEPTLARWAGLSHIERVDVAFEFQREGSPTVATVARLLLAARAHRGTIGRVYLEPLVTLDRTMDVLPGLLDQQCNPRSIFHAVRCVNTLCNASDRSLELISPHSDRGACEQRLAPSASSEPVRVYRLEQGLVKACGADDVQAIAAALADGETLLAEA